MIDEDFLYILENKICEALQHMSDEAVSGFWCDGVIDSAPDVYYSPKYINDHRQTMFTAWIGKRGEMEFSLVLHFGDKSLSRFVRGLEIISCIPGSDAETWFRIELPHKRVQVQLD